MFKSLKNKLEGRMRLACRSLAMSAIDAIIAICLNVENDKILLDIAGLNRIREQRPKRFYGQAL